MTATEQDWRLDPLEHTPIVRGKFPPKRPGPTEGPWTANEFGAVYGPQKQMIAAVLQMDDFPAAATVDLDADAALRAECDANLRLITAAPLLLKTMRVAAKMFEHYERLHQIKNTPEADVKAESNRQLAAMCQAAIIAAAGELV